MARGASAGGQPGWLVRCVILLSAAPISLAFSCVAPILPKMSAALARDAADAYMVKMVLGVVGLAMVLGSLLAGVLADRIPRRVLLAAAALVFAVAGAAPILLDSLPLILATRLVMGLAAMAAYIAGAALIADCFDEAGRAKWMGLFTAVAVAVGLAAMLAGGALGDLGWRWPFLGYLAGAPLAVLAWAALGGPPAAAAAGRASAAAGPARSRGPFPWTLVLLGLLTGFVIYAPSIYMPFHLASLGATSPSVIGRSLTVSMISSTASSALFGRARLRLSSRAAFGWSFALLAAGLAALAAAPGFPVALAGLFVMGLGMGALSPNLMASAADAVDESLRGRTLGLVRAAYSVAPALGVTALEPVASRVGPQGVLLLTAALALAAAAGAAVTALGRRTPGAQRA